MLNVGLTSLRKMDFLGWCDGSNCNAWYDGTIYAMALTQQDYQWWRDKLPHDGMPYHTLQNLYVIVMINQIKLLIPSISQTWNNPVITRCTQINIKCLQPSQIVVSITPALHGFVLPAVDLGDKGMSVDMCVSVFLYQRTEIGLLPLSTIYAHMIRCRTVIHQSFDPTL